MTKFLSNILPVLQKLFFDFTAYSRTHVFLHPPSALATQNQIQFLDYFKYTVLVSLSCLITACTPSVINRSKEMETFSKAHDFHKQQVKAGQFTLTTYQKITDPQAPYVFYIEGDGYAFESYGVS